MGVIGRLDKQVDEIIIKPLSRRDGRENEEQQAFSKETEPPHQTVTAEEQARDEENTQVRSNNLPVWLL